MKFLTSFIFFILILFTPFLSFSQKSVQEPPPGISEIQWKQFDHRWERQRIDLIVTKLDSQLVKGQLLAASLDGIWVWPSETVFTPKLGYDKVIYIPADQLYKLKFSQNHTFWQGAGVGAIVGGSLLGGFFMSKSDGVYTPYALTGTIGFILGGLVAGSISGWVYNANEIQKEFLIESKVYLMKTYAEEFSTLAIFPDENAFSQIKKLSIDADHEELLIATREQSSKYKKLFPSHNIHFTGRMGVGYSPAQDQILETLSTEGIVSEFNNSSTIFPAQVEASINITPRLRLGGSNFAKIRSQASGDQRVFGGSAFSFETSVSGWGGFVEFIPKPVDPFFKNRSEFLVGIGLYRTEIGIYSFLDDPDFIDDVWQQDPWDKEHQQTNLIKPMLHLRVGYEYYVSKFISIQMQAQSYLIQPIEIARRDFASDIVSEPIYQPKFDLNYSSVNVSLGVRLHIPVR